MSVRGTKRVRGEEPGVSKRRRTDPDDAHKMSSIYNRSASETPAELFRKDLISAMKLPDSEPLAPSGYWVITDQWKQDWERGVQVPVKPESLPAPKVKIIDNPLPDDFQEFRLPRDKYIHLSRDASYHPEKHFLSTTLARAEAACSYDLDATDTAWLKLLNAERARAGAAPVTEDQLEKVIEELEVRTGTKIQAIVKSEEGQGIEYDENVICDVCRSPDSEDGNEMVFCDSCNICVHQACYGITVIPAGKYGRGQWLCRPCGDGVHPFCVLCPNDGGAMKCTPSGHKWAHVSCVLWIPEVSIGCAEKMEPITKISAIPMSRWSLICVLCRQRKGACIQCSVKTCKTAYHVTCAFKYGLEMRAIIEDENADDGVKLRSYCQKHSVNSKKEKCPGSGSEEEEVKRKRRKDMTSEEKTQARAARRQEFEREFDRHVSVKDISTHLLDVDQDAINYIYNYWKLKRRAGHNRPLLPPKSDDNELLTHRQEQADVEKMKMFVQLRQDLERVRNLCYMVSRREKLSRSFFRMREQTFHKQVAVLSADVTISGPDLIAIIEANHGPSIYDRLYSHENAPDHKNDFDDLLARIAPMDSGDEKKKDRNGLLKGSKSANPYKKHYVNGSRRSGSMYSGLSSGESASEMRSTSRYRGRALGSSTDDDAKKSGSSPKKKVSPKGKGKRSPKKIERKKKIPQSKALVESSSEEEENIKSRLKKDRTRSRTLQQMEKEMAAGRLNQSGSDSDDIIPMKSTRSHKFPMNIYSDSSEDLSSQNEIKKEKAKSAEKSPHENDSQHSFPRTKAAMKEFIPSHPEKKTPVKEEDKTLPKKRGRKPSNKDKKTTTTTTSTTTSSTANTTTTTTPIKSNDSDDEAKNKENIKLSKQKEHATDLIVPQRQAAKKASENMRSTTAVKKEESVSDKQVSGDDAKSKPKVKSKGKEVKEVVAAKVGRKKSTKDAEKETIAYVPQRQAAKKAAAHIKSGLGTKLPATEVSEGDKKKDNEKYDESKIAHKKEDGKVAKSRKESSSSSSNSSSSSYSSSSSSDEEEEEKPGLKPTAKAREIKPVARQPSMFSPPGSRPTVDLPFLDKVSRPLSSTSASSDSDSSKASRFSGSGSPSPKRPRRRRKGKTLSTDSTLRKAPDKKLKTSERGSELRVSSPTTEGEEQSRPDARAATRARTRSITSSGNLPNKPDARQRKPSKDSSGLAAGPNKTPKESGEPSELSFAERKADPEIKKELKDSPDKVVKNKKQSESVEDKDAIKMEIDTIVPRSSPRKSAELKHKPVVNRRKSVKESEKVKDQKESVNDGSGLYVAKERRLSRRDSLSDDIKVSPLKKSSIDKPSVDFMERKSPMRIDDDFPGSDKNWLPSASSPSIHPPPVERSGGHEKYMSDDKYLDSDYADKSSINMIEKIQANLNENTMIKSPKTPMDARMEMTDIDPMFRSRKRSAVDTDKKFMTQDSSHVQGVEISKSAKIPSSVNPFPHRSILSPHSKDYLEYPVFVDEPFNHEDMMKPFAPYPALLKEDSKEQGAQETLNLVDRLRMQYSNAKKKPSENVEPIVAADKDPTEDQHNIPTNSQHLSVNPPTPNIDLHTRKSTSVNHTVHGNDITSREDLEKDQHIVPIAASEKWSNLPSSHTDMQLEQCIDRRKYDRPASYQDEVKEPPATQSDTRSVSEVGDSISKQSDDSQSLSVVDHSIHSNDNDLTQDNHNYDNNNSLIHSDCAASPYLSHDAKWNESKITTRRSSASSTNSEGSISSQKEPMKTHLNSCDPRPNNTVPDIDSYPPLPPYSCAVESNMPLNQYSTNYVPDPYLNTLGSLPLFGPGTTSQLPLPTSAAGLYSPALPFPQTSHIQPLTKSTFPTLCAAFTSSSQNIALTTAMIAPPTPKPSRLDSPHDDIDVTGSDKFSIHVNSSPSISIDSFNESSSRAPTKMSNDSNETVINLQPTEPKSPLKPVKAVTKLPGKSPGKSPGFSPKQSEAPKGTKRSSNKGRSQRGRGRSKSRGQGHNFAALDYMGNSIQSNLVGTVYDFDEEIANDGVDLKALRERRKSVDVRDDRKSEHSQKESPRIASPHDNKKPVTIEQEVKAPPAIGETRKSPSSKVSSERGAGFCPVQPVLPGPVDMRTYQPFDNPAQTSSTDAFHSHLLAFASGTADQQLTELDEDDEKQLHSELMAGKKPGLPAPVETLVDPVKEVYTPTLPKVSLSDSRNQLKVKIKGPFLDKNYSASSVQTVAPLPPAPALDTSTTVVGVGAGQPSSMMGGSTNLRRMRKKELLRQYVNQDMNMDEPPSAAPPPLPPPLGRAVITIPKAVASMTSIPTREDYKIVDTPIEKKKRKMTSGLSRELRHLQVSMNADSDLTDEAKLACFPSSANATHKRRGRVNTKPNRNPTSPVAPKLKIKIGTNVVPHVSEEPTGFQFRPPKKRLVPPVPTPSIEVLKRESMKYRKKVMADFEENEKAVKYKPDKSEKRKKKKDKKAEKLQSESVTKLIIKIKRTKEEEANAGDGAVDDGASVSGAAAAAAAAPEPLVDSGDFDPTARDPLQSSPSHLEASSSLRKIRTAKVTPIRLKIARSSQGEGYVMKGPNQTGEKPADAAAESGRPEPPAAPATDASPSAPAAVNKHCEVR